MSSENEHRRLPPSEHHACYVGGGECYIPAAFVTDNGEGGVVYICPLHRKEMEKVENCFREIQMNDPHKFEQLEAAIDQAYRKQIKEEQIKNENPIS